METISVQPFIFSISCTYCHARQDVDTIAESTFKKCSRCRFAFYCNQTCQRADWPIHKQSCTTKCNQSPFSDTIQHILNVFHGDIKCNKFLQAKRTELNGDREIMPHVFLFGIEPNLTKSQINSKNILSIVSDNMILLPALECKVFDHYVWDTNFYPYLITDPTGRSAAVVCAKNNAPVLNVNVEHADFRAQLVFVIQHGAHQPDFAATLINTFTSEKFTSEKLVAEYESLCDEDKRFLTLLNIIALKREENSDIVLNLYCKNKIGYCQYIWKKGSG